MSSQNNYSDPIIYRMRSGSTDDPFLPLTQTDKVRNNIILLYEVPDKFQGISISDGTNSLSTIDSGLPDSNKVLVDWTNGILTFHQINDGKTYTINYFGKGNIYLPSSKVATQTDENGDVTETLKTLTDDTRSAKDDTVAAINNANTQASYAKNQGDYAKGIRDNFGHKGKYSPSVAYKNGNVVTYGGINYICIQDTTAGIDPLNGAYWTVVSPQATINKQTWTATEGQTVFTITNGNYVISQGNIEVLVGGVSQVTGIGFTETNSTTITLSEGVPAGTVVFAKWFEGSMTITKGHKSSHEQGGQDELDVTKLKNFQEQVASPLATKMNQDAILSMANMGQDVKTAMTGGSVAVVGIGSTGFANLTSEVQKSIGIWDIVSVNVLKGYIDNTGAVNSMTTGYNKYGIMNVVEGERYKAFVYTVNDLNEIMFINSSNAVISSVNLSSNSNDYYEYEFVIPSNCAKVYINARSGFVVWKSKPVITADPGKENTMQMLQDITSQFNFSTNGYYYIDSTANVVLNSSDTNNKSATITLSAGIYNFEIPKYEVTTGIAIPSSNYLVPTTKGNQTNAQLIKQTLILTQDTQIYVSICTNASLNPNNYAFKCTKIVNQSLSTFVKGANTSILIGSSTLSDAKKKICDYVCTGVADQTIINQAIQALPTSGGKIQLSAGLFNVNAPIIIDRNVIFEGEGGGLTLDTSGNTVVYGTTIKTTIDTTAIQISVTQYPKRGIQVKNMQLTGIGLKNNPTGSGINITNDIDVAQFQNLNINNFKFGIKGEGAFLDALSITNCSIQRNVLGFYCDHMDQSRIENNIFWDSYGLYQYGTTVVQCGGIAINGGSNNIISGNTFGRMSFDDSGFNTDSGVYRNRSAISITKNSSANNLIANNHFSEIYGNPIYIQGCARHTIIGNTFATYGCNTFSSSDRAGIRLDTCNDITINANTFFGDTYDVYAPYWAVVASACNKTVAVNNVCRKLAAGASPFTFNGEATKVEQNNVVIVS